MGKKDAQGARGPPVEQYRKEIGKNQYKKTDKDVKGAKRDRDLQKSSTPFKDGVLMLVAFLCLLLGVYALLYLII